MGPVNWESLIACWLVSSSSATTPDFSLDGEFSPSRPSPVSSSWMDDGNECTLRKLDCTRKMDGRGEGPWALRASRI